MISPYQNTFLKEANYTNISGKDHLGHTTPYDYVHFNIYLPCCQTIFSILPKNAAKCFAKAHSCSFSGNKSPRSSPQQFKAFFEQNRNFFSRRNVCNKPPLSQAPRLANHPHKLLFIVGAIHESPAKKPVIARVLQSAANLLIYDCRGQSHNNLNR